MPSASPDIDDGLIGIDPDDEEVVQYGPATFTVGVLPAGLWEDLTSRYMLARQEAMRRNTRRLNADGLDPDEVVLKLDSGVELKRVDLAISNEDPQFIRDTREVFLEAARFGVRGHTNFRNRKGVEFAFELDEDGGMSPETLRLYGANIDLVRALWTHLRKLNDFGAVGKKA